MRTVVATILIYFALLSGGCALIAPPPGVGKAVPWSKLDGWDQDRHAESWPALLRTCEAMTKKAEWQPVCTAAQQQQVSDDFQARRFYEKWFTPHRVYAANRRRSGMITGYYEPLLSGSRQSSPRFRYPVYAQPDDLLTIELTSLHPELKGKRVRGKLVGRKVVPYHDRGKLDADPDLLAGNELLWVDDPVALFFLHIQGSGRVQLPDGQVVGVGYADQNGHPYRSIGRELVKMGEMQLDQVDLFSIRDWLHNHPDRAEALFARNPSYVFFVLRDTPQTGPYGSLNVPLTPERSIAVDRSVIPLGLPVWLETTQPIDETPYRRLVLAQDTGGAIKGHVRADLFWGQGARAEQMAGLMKQKGRLYVLKLNHLQSQ